PCTRAPAIWLTRPRACPSSRSKAVTDSRVMKRSTKTWLGAIGVFVAYVVIAVLVVVLARVSGARMWWIGGTLTLLGLISAGILLWYFRDSLREPAPASPAASIDAILAAARAN